MSQIELILLERVAHLGQMGDVVRVKPGYARNFLLPKGKALRANETNRKRFEADRAQLEALNLKKREEAERLAERMDGLAVVIIRQAGDSGSLYGSVTSRDIAEAITVSGLTVERTQVVLPHPIKLLGLVAVQVVLHPEVTISVTVNVARSEEEAERQAKGEVIGPEHDDVEEPEVHAGEGEVVAEAEATEEVRDVSES